VAADAVAPGAVRAVLFDADGVMQQNPAGWEASLRRYGDGFVEDLFASEAPAMTGARSFPDVLDEVVARWKLPVAASELLGHWREVEVSPSSVAVVRALQSSGIGCHLASNQHAYRADYMRSELGYDELFDAQFYSCDLGVMKSSPKYFALVLDRLGRAAGEVLLVDDGSSYVESARSAGLRAVRWCIDDGVPALRHLLASHGLSA
jgi:putative hydrolase of the HAD superfamily